MKELVALPDPIVSPLVHPLDLPEARRLFRNSWLIDTLTRFEVGLCLAVVIWFLSDNFVAPLLAGAATIGFGHLASRHAANQAWDYIVGRRQDRQRPVSLAWAILAWGAGAMLVAEAVVEGSRYVQKRRS